MDNRFKAKDNQTKVHNSRDVKKQGEPLKWEQAMKEDVAQLPLKVEDKMEHYAMNDTVPEPLKQEKKYFK